jgi:hypothetical protein
MLLGWMDEGGDGRGWRGDASVGGWLNPIARRMSVRKNESRADDDRLTNKSTTPKIGDY